MYLVYFDESGNSGTGLDTAQPLFVLCALVVPEEKWMALERDLQSAIESAFPSPRPADFEIHANELANPRGFFRLFPIAHRLKFRDSLFEVARRHSLRVIYRAIEKKRLQRWVTSTLGAGVTLNPHIAAFPLVARVVNDHLRALPGQPLGIIISDENREVVRDIEKSIRLLRGIEGQLQLSQIVEKGFFIESHKSLPLQLCDLCAYAARKAEEQRLGFTLKPLDTTWVGMVEPLIFRGDERFQDVNAWLIQQQKKERPGAFATGRKGRTHTSRSKQCSKPIVRFQPLICGFASRARPQEHERHELYGGKEARPGAAISRTHPAFGIVSTLCRRTSNVWQEKSIGFGNRIVFTVRFISNF